MDLPEMLEDKSHLQMCKPTTMTAITSNKEICKIKMRKSKMMVGKIIIKLDKSLHVLFFKYLQIPNHMAVMHDKTHEYLLWVGTYHYMYRNREQKQTHHN